MKRVMVTLILVCLIGLVAASPARAYRRGEKAIDVKIDFDFTAGDQILPAGSYRVRHPTSDFALIEIESAGGKKTVLVAASRLARRPAGGNPDTGLVFKKVGSTFVLSEVWLQDLDGFLMRHQGDAGTSDGAAVKARSGSR
jgi:hypothetical protein